MDKEHFRRISEPESGLIPQKQACADDLSTAWDRHPLQTKKGGQENHIRLV